MCDKQAIGASMDGILKSEQFPMATQLCSTLFPFAGESVPSTTHH